MVAAVRKMQADYGIEPDGLIGSDALEILNLSDAIAPERSRSTLSACAGWRANRLPPAST